MISAWSYTSVALIQLVVVLLLLISQVATNSLPVILVALRSTSHVMPSYCLQDCHYFYRTALRGLNISTTVSPLYA
jgi:hypothetical protein